jgi:hypothetical protein
MGTFTREELANHGKTAAETQEEIVEEAGDKIADFETDDDAADEAAVARLDAERAAAPRAVVEREPEMDEAPLRFPDLPADEPMPDLSDPDIEYDNEKYRVKMATWVKTQGKIEARRLLREEQQSDIAQKNRMNVEQKAAAFEKAHPDFKEKVRENKVLAAYQLHPDAGRIMVRSKYTAELLYRFGNDEALAIRTAQANPTQQGAIIDRMISEIEAEKAKSAPRQPTLTRKAPVTRDQQMGTSAADLARQSRERKAKSRFYGK